MAEWFKTRLESIVDNLIFSAIVAGVAIVWAIIGALPIRVVIAIGISIFLIIVIAIRVIWALRFKGKQQAEPIGLKATLKIGAKVKSITTSGYDDKAFGGGSEGDKEVTVDVILEPSKPMTLDILTLNLWGKRFEAKVQRDVAPFDLIQLTPISLTNAGTRTVIFHVPKESAIDTKKAGIYALTGNLVDWFSEPFAINFGE